MVREVLLSPTLCRFDSGRYRLVVPPLQARSNISNPQSFVETLISVCLGTVKRSKSDRRFGTRDVHGFQDFLHGSVSSAVAQEARCSVEVVRLSDPPCA
jgi:hypothetical protein